MAETSAIEWTDATWNPVTGCSLVSEGCRHCYAARLAATRLKEHPSRKGLARLNAAGEAKFTGEVRFNEQWLDQPLRWRRPRRIFVAAHGDLFHESVPDEWIDQVFAVMALAREHQFQVLTKRPARMRDYVHGLYGGLGLNFDRLAAHAARISGSPCAVGAIEDCDLPLPTVWLGVSAEDQARADERIPPLLDTPAAVRFLSAEPLLGPIDLSAVRWWDEDAEIRADVLTAEAWIENSESASAYANESDGVTRLDWVIVGGESGPGARPMHPDWARSLRDQCRAARVPFFFKQWGAWGPGAEFAAHLSARRAYRGEVQTLRIAGSRDVKLCIPTRDDDALGPALTLEQHGKKIAGRTLDGRTWEQMPGAGDA